MSKKAGNLMRTVEHKEKTIESLQAQAELDQEKIDTLTAQVAEMTQKHGIAVKLSAKAMGIALDIKIRHALVGLWATTLA